LALQVGEDDSLWRLELVRGEAGLEATLYRRDYLDTELEVIMTVVAMRKGRGVMQNTSGGIGL
jgi:hypothetical protein